MDKIELIKAEIERRKAIATAMLFPGQAQLCEGLLDFINSLPEEKPGEDLEKAAALEDMKEQKDKTLDKAFEQSRKDFPHKESEKAIEYSENILPTSVYYGESDSEYKLHKIIEAAFIAGEKSVKEQMRGSSEKPNTHYNGLEKAAEEFAHKYDMGTCDGIAQDSFKAGAQWQKEQDEKAWLKDRDGCFWDGVEEGKKVMREQMMEDTDLRPSWKPSEDLPKWKKQTGTYIEYGGPEIVEYESELLPIPEELVKECSAILFGKMDVKELMFRRHLHKIIYEGYELEFEPLLKLPKEDEK